MQRTCIAVVDATRARLFSFDRDTENGQPREAMSERIDLVNPARRRRPSELFSSGMGTFEDHREANLDNMDADFARSIVQQIERTLADIGSHHLIVCASPKMLGQLRAADLRRNGVVIDELARDYVKLTPPQLREQLAEQGLLPGKPPRVVMPRQA